MLISILTECTLLKNTTCKNSGWKHLKLCVLHHPKCLQQCSNQRNPQVYSSWWCVSLGHRCYFCDEVTQNLSWHYLIPPCTCVQPVTVHKRLKRDSVSSFLTRTVPVELPIVYLEELYVWMQIQITCSFDIRQGHHYKVGGRQAEVK